MEASLQLPHVGHSADRRSDRRSLKLPLKIELVCQNHYSDTKMNRSFAWKAFTKTEKLYLHTENIQELEISISETPAVAELGASTFAFCRRTKLLIQSVSQNNVIYSASDVLHNTHLFTQGQRENGNQDPDMTSSCNS